MKIEKPNAPSAISNGSLARIAGQSLAKCRRPSSHRITTAMPQRAAVSSIGEMWPTASLPAIALPPQNNVVSSSRR